MAEKILVEKVRKAIKELEAQYKRPASMIMLVSSPSSLDSKFSLLISAPWLDEKSPKQAIEMILVKLKGTLETEEFRRIARITPIKTTDRFVKEARAQQYPPEQDRLDIVNCNVSGMHIDRATLLVTKP
ncbi:MAG: hypothetical protein HYW07_10275 [Candidatus Latescibacteria bacterium]|nr:hypothetical protein [Candidatus Latescibacterota bacterium]